MCTLVVDPSSYRHMGGVRVLGAVGVLAGGLHTASLEHRQQRRFPSPSRSPSPSPNGRSEST